MSFCCRLPGVSLILGGVDVVPAPSSHFCYHCQILLGRLYALISLELLDLQYDDIIS